MSATTAGATHWRVWGQGLSTTQQCLGNHSKRNGEQLIVHLWVEQTKSKQNGVFGCRSPRLEFATAAA